MAPAAGKRDLCGQPYHDSARSWLVALACSWILFWVMIMNRCGGIIFVTIINEMGASRETASWPFNLQGAIFNVSGIITGVLLRKFPLRDISLAGALLSALGGLLCAVFYDIVGITISYGVICAIGQGLTILSNNFAVNIYFKRYRGSASGLSWTGGSLVTLVFPAVIVYLNDQYGLRGTFIIVGGLALNAAAGSLLIQNPENFVTKARTASSKERLDRDGKGIDVERLSDTYSQQLLSDTDEVRLSQNGYGDAHDKETMLALMPAKAPVELEVPPAKLLSEKSAWISDAGESGNGVAGREVFLHQFSRSPLASTLALGTREGEGQTDSVTGCQRRVYAVLSTVRRELSFLKRPMNYVITLAAVVHVHVLDLFTLTLADHAMGQGLPKWQAAALLSCTGVGDIVGRLFSGQLSDRKLCHRRDVMAAGFLVMGSSLVGLIYANSMASLVFVAVLFGLVCGSLIILFAVITVEYLGLKNLPLALSFHSLARAIVAVPRPFVIGYYRDRRESYTGLYVLLATVCFVTGLLWTAECFMQWRATRWCQEEQTSSKEAAA
ncbi:monocarboxylate transporter 12-like isoform X2 [Haemaphysalis longicornis]